MLFRSKRVIDVLDDYSWPGNVRELANIIQKALIFSRGAPISPEDISQAIHGDKLAIGTGTENADQAISQWVRETLISKAEEKMFDSSMDRIAKIIIREALNLTGGNRSQAAKLLGLSRPTLHSKIEKYNLKFEMTVKEDQSHS